MSARLTKAEKERREKQHQREVLVSKAKLFLIVLCGVAIVVSFVVSRIEISGVGDRVTRIESPCQRFGSESKVCEEAFETAVKSITHRIACFIDRKAGKPFKPTCRGVRLRIDQAQPVHTEPHNAAGHRTPSDVQVVPDSGIRNGGDADSSPPQGTSQPSPHGGGGAGKNGGSGGNGGQPSNPAPSSPSPTQPSAPSPSSRSESSATLTPPPSSGGEAPSPPPAPEPAPAEPIQPITEGLGSTIEEVGSDVGEVLENANGVLCSTTGALGLPCSK